MEMVEVYVTYIGNTIYRLWMYHIREGSHVLQIIATS